MPSEGIYIYIVIGCDGSIMVSKANVVLYRSIVSDSNLWYRRSCLM